MKLKKLTALVLASMMIASTATAVPVSAAEDNEYSVFAILNGEYDLADNLTMQTTLEEAGLKFDFTSVMVWAQTWQRKETCFWHPAIIRRSL